MHFNPIPSTSHGGTLGSFFLFYLTFSSYLECFCLLQPVNMPLCLFAVSLRSTRTRTPWPCAGPRMSGDPTRVRPAEGSSEGFCTYSTPSPTTPGPHSQLLTRLCITINKARPSLTRDSQLREYLVTIDVWTRDFEPCWILHILCSRRGKKKKVLSDTTVWLWRGRKQRWLPVVRKSLLLPHSEFCTYRYYCFSIGGFIYYRLPQAYMLQ